ncbi:hypothetical protein GCM10009798_09900 [Nocardioides panacihumi]|uniref:Peptidase M10 metallopeptidase domain-containing protein n=1 Tax=Nocardioides panacihumi TaxID=400774 RepID=A0ABP5BUB5_9ACTN
MSRPLRPSYVALALACLLAIPGLPGLAGSAATAAAPTPHPVSVGVSVIPGTAALNRRVPVAGTVVDATTHGPVAGVRVALEIRSAHGWARPPGAAVVTDDHGRFTLNAPTFYYGRHVFRVAAAAHVGVDATIAAGASAAGAVTVPMPYRPAGRASAGRTDSTQFDPCEPIPVRINYAGAPRNAHALVAAALTRARAATGLTFTYAGRYSGVPFSRQRNGGLPPSGIGFAWSTSRTVSGLAGPTIGLGGGGWAINDRRTSSGVVIDRSFHFRQGWTGPNSIGGLLLHELGHALGLEHVKDRSQQMYPLDIGAPNGNYNRGDLAALRRVGLDAGCL